MAVGCLVRRPKQMSAHRTCDCRQSRSRRVFLRRSRHLLTVPNFITSDLASVLQSYTISRFHISSSCAALADAGTGPAVVVSTAMYAAV